MLTTSSHRRPHLWITPESTDPAIKYQAWLRNSMYGSAVGSFFFGALDNLRYYDQVPRQITGNVNLALSVAIATVTTLALKIIAEREFRKMSPAERRSYVEPLVEKVGIGIIVGIGHCIVPAVIIRDSEIATFLFGRIAAEPFIVVSISIMVIWTTTVALTLLAQQNEASIRKAGNRN